MAALPAVPLPGVRHGWARGAFSLTAGALIILGAVVSRGVTTRVSQAVLPR